jgi:hypothetical protein
MVVPISIDQGEHVQVFEGGIEGVSRYRFGCPHVNIKGRQT